MNTLQEFLNFGREELADDCFNEREEELIRITMDILSVNRHEIILNKNKQLSQQQINRFREIIQQRKTGQPLAYILGYSYFYHHKFPVSKQTLIPRYDTENLVEAIRKTYSVVDFFNILDIGTGTGAIALSLAFLFPNADITGIDIFDTPFKTSQKELNISEKQAKIKKMNFLDQRLWSDLGKWDCIVSNPPYLDETDMNNLHPFVRDFEPHTALYAEDQGMAFYKAIAEFTKNHLVEGGHVFLEIDHKYQSVIDIFYTLSPVKTHTLIDDLSGLPRVLIFNY